MGVFLGEFETFSNKVESHTGDSLSLLIFLPLDVWLCLDVLMGVRAVTLPRPNGAQFLSRPEMEDGVLTA